MKLKRCLIIIFSAVLTISFLGSCKKRTGLADPTSPFGPSTFAMLLELSVSPNVLFAGTNREYTTIEAKLKKFDGTPLPGETIHFSLRDALGLRSTVGYFDGNLTAASRTTDQNGNITLKYHGPMADEILTDLQLYIYATLDWEGTDYITESAGLLVLQGVVDVSFEILAQPNILLCTSERPLSVIKGVFKRTNGTPIANRRVYFFILSGPGEFEDGTTESYAVTDSNGEATITYVGPKGGELSVSQFVEIRGQPETNSPNYMHEEIFVRLIKGS